GIQVPNPVDFQRSNWSGDPFSLGCFSNIPVGATGADYDVMALPVPYAANQPASANRLFFAGEATHRQHPISVWGAYESGQREAKPDHPSVATQATKSTRAAPLPGAAGRPLLAGDHLR